MNIHDMLEDDAYDSDYNEAHYGSKNDIKKTFERIINLKPSESDNYHRVQRVLECVEDLNIEVSSKNVRFLDIGSGLGVFPYSLKQRNLDVTSIDPDAKACAHLENDLQIKTIHGDFEKAKIEDSFDVVTLNKVLEHIKNPLPFLRKLVSILSKTGFAYIELPDGEAAAMESYERSEFTLYHYHIFSFNSFIKLCQSVNLHAVSCCRIKDPSGKYTLWGTFRHSPLQ